MANENSSQLSIVNAALALLSKQQIDIIPTSQDEADEQGQSWAYVITRAYPDAYDEVLSARPWSAARAIRQLTYNPADVDPPDQTLGRLLFRQPADFLRAVGVNAGATWWWIEDCPALWQQRGQFIEVASGGTEAIFLEYVARVPEADLANAPLLRRAIAAQLAANVARQLTEGQAQQTQMLQLAAQYLEVAWRSDAGQKSATIGRRSLVLDAISGYSERGVARVPGGYYGS